MSEITEKKIHRNFKISGELDKKLRAAKKKTRLSQTAILEAALENYFAGGLSSQLNEASDSVAGDSLLEDSIAKVKSARKTRS
jgi:hypothetical protein